MNKHILLVMKWLKNPKLITVSMLEKNMNSAYHESSGSVDSSHLEVAYHVSHAAYCSTATSAVYYWVDKYFHITGENKEEYELMVGF
jgi:uncharacterized protein YpmB